MASKDSTKYFQCASVKVRLKQNSHSLICTINSKEELKHN